MNNIYNKPLRRAWGRGAWGGGGGAMHPPSWGNYFKIMQFFTRNWLLTPNFGLKIRIFWRFASPFVKTLKFAPPLPIPPPSPPFKSLRTGLYKLCTIMKKNKVGQYTFEQVRQQWHDFANWGESCIRLKIKWQSFNYFSVIVICW